MLDWLKDHQALLYSLGGGTVALLVATVLIVPPVIARIPADYFVHPHRPRRRWADRRWLRIPIGIAKNILGYVCLITGLLMLLLPGPGMLTLVVGVLLIDFPGKYRLEQWVFSRPPVLSAINWLRRRRGRAPLRVA